MVKSIVVLPLTELYFVLMLSGDVTATNGTFTSGPSAG